MKKYIVQISYLCLDSDRKGEPVEEQVFKQFDCIVPAALFYFKAKHCPALIDDINPQFTSKLLLKYLLDYRVNLYK